ncbi:hypothetical protein [Streptomyces tropicalis]|uniref:Uncharacterized protein n=1 Tax=Streptomyces tropicalis TaxID=3034234 RepID=A0ABT6A7H5_9ACTN|nr:hypothetical protein [Streptomyces tropicalis]MDF3300601.1 hypothetical protein [Streptomyces tropicalis]
MPTPYGTRGGMAFGVEELRVLRRALALALHPRRPASPEDARDCLRLAESLDEAMREGVRLRAFLLADLARYRAALPGAASGYTTLLREALAAGHRPGPDDLAALGALGGDPAAAALLDRCRILAVPAVPASRTPLRTAAARLPGARAGRDDAAGEPRKPAPKPAERPAPAPSGPTPAPGAPKPGRRPVPTPGEVFPRRKPAPRDDRPQQLVAV